MDLQDRLTEFIARKSGAKDVVISNLVRLSGGASRHTWSFDFDFDRGNGPEHIEAIYRADPVPGDTSPGRRLEYDLISRPGRTA